MPALLQALPKSGDKAHNLKTIARAARMAELGGCAFLTCPELFVTGYNLGEALRDLAEPIDGPSVAALRRIAAERGIGLVVGFPEKAGSRVHNSAVAISSTGDILGCYRKIQLFGEVEPMVFTPGGQTCVVEMGTYRVGLAICYDIEFPEFARALARQGADVIAVPTANMQPHVDVPTTLLRARALESSVAIVYANLHGSEGDLDYTGLSAIVGPHGHDIARAGDAGECFLGCSADRLLPEHFAARPLGTQLRDLNADLR
jgi:5-aminopentanamidase